MEPRTDCSTGQTGSLIEAHLFLGARRMGGGIGRELTGPVLLANKAKLTAQARLGPHSLKMAALTAQRYSSRLVPGFLDTLAQRDEAPRKVILTKV